MDLLTDKVAYATGQAEAMARYGMPTEQPQAAEKKKEKSKSWLPALAAAGIAGAGTYAMMRRPTFSKVPGLKRIQQQASSKGFHRAVDVTPGERPEGWKPFRVGEGVKKMVTGDGEDRAKVISHAYDNFTEWMKPKVNPKGELDTLNKFKLWATEGGEAIPYAYKKDGTQYVPGAPNGKVKIKGVAAGRAPFTEGIISGGTDYEGSMETQRALTRMSTKGKGYEADIFNRYAPDAIPETRTDLTKYFKGVRPTKDSNARVQAIRAVQERMRQDMLGADAPAIKPPKGLTSPQVKSKTTGPVKAAPAAPAPAGGKGSMGNFALKPVDGFQSDGAFALGHEDWGAHLSHYDKFVSNPKNLKALKKYEAAGGDNWPWFLEEHGLTEGYALNRAMSKPESVLAQDWLPGAQGEWRVHTMGGAAPKNMMLPRYFSAQPGRSVKELLGFGGPDRDAMQQFVEGTLKKMPKKYREGQYGMDVMHFKDPTTGQSYFKVIEANPSELMGYNGSAGGGSGLLDTKNVPWMGHAHYRAATGRHTTPVSLAAGLGAAGVAGTAARVMTPESEDDDSPHPVG